MAKIAFTPTKRNTVELIAQANRTIGRLAPPAPEPPPLPGVAARLASYAACRDAAVAANDAYVSAKSALVALLLARNAAAEALRQETKALIALCEGVTGGDALGLTGTGFPLAAPNTRPNRPPEREENFRLTVQDEPGVLKGRVKPVEYAFIYEVQLSTTGIAEGFVTVLSPTKSSWKLRELTSGVRVWVRVRAHGSQGPGPWSEVRWRIVS